MAFITIHSAELGPIITWLSLLTGEKFFPVKVRVFPPPLLPEDGEILVTISSYLKVLTPVEDGYA